MEESKVKDFIKFQCSRKIVNLYKQYLFTLEDLRSGQYNITDEEVYQRIRKRILDEGNDTVREIDGLLDKVEVKLK